MPGNARAGTRKACQPHRASLKQQLSMFPKRASAACGDPSALVKGTRRLSSITYGAVANTDVVLKDMLLTCCGQQIGSTQVVSLAASVLAAFAMAAFAATGSFSERGDLAGSVAFARTLNVAAVLLGSTPLFVSGFFWGFMDRSVLVAQHAFGAGRKGGEADNAARAAGLRYSVPELLQVCVVLMVTLGFTLWAKLPWRKEMVATLLFGTIGFAVGVQLFGRLRVFAVVRHRDKIHQYVAQLGSRMQITMMGQLFFWVVGVLRAASLLTPVITPEVVERWLIEACETSAWRPCLDPIVRHLAPSCER
jgi:hypothetical protein